MVCSLSKFCKTLVTRYNLPNHYASDQFKNHKSLMYLPLWTSWFVATLCMVMILTEVIETTNFLTFPTRGTAVSIKVATCTLHLGHVIHLKIAFRSCDIALRSCD